MLEQLSCICTLQFKEIECLSDDYVDNLLNGQFLGPELEKKNLFCSAILYIGSGGKKTKREISINVVCVIVVLLFTRQHQAHQRQPK